MSRRLWVVPWILVAVSMSCVIESVSVVDLSFISNEEIGEWFGEPEASQQFPHLRLLPQ